MLDPDLATVLANPDDDAPRRRLAERLRAAGGPRGRFFEVQLQLAGLPRRAVGRP
ncbi:MAG: hypothetical protein IPM29_19885 [Planctomycetes bacterium]|nr:hypothetical protein [Planctomycetota bacterium]